MKTTEDKSGLLQLTSCRMTSLFSCASLCPDERHADLRALRTQTADSKINCYEAQQSTLFYDLGCAQTTIGFELCMNK